MDIALLFSQVNWTAVAALTIISFPLGAVWHSKALFGKAWKQDAKPAFDPSKKGASAKLFGTSAVFHFVAMLALSIYIGQGSTPMNGLLKGLFVSVAWVATSMGVTYLFAGRPLRLFFIDAGFYVVLFSVAGMILGIW